MDRGGKHRPQASQADISNKITARQWLHRNRPGSAISPKDLSALASCEYFDVHGSLPPWKKGSDGIDRNFYAAEDFPLLERSCQHLELERASRLP